MWSISWICYHGRTTHFSNCNLVKQDYLVLSLVSLRSKIRPHWPARGFHQAPGTLCPESVSSPPHPDMRPTAMGPSRWNMPSTARYTSHEYIQSQVNYISPTMLNIAHGNIHEVQHMDAPHSNTIISGTHIFNYSTLIIIYFRWN